MAEPSGRAIVERYARALQDKDHDALALLVTDDHVDEMPQSGNASGARRTSSPSSATTPVESDRSIRRAHDS